MENIIIKSKDVFNNIYKVEISPRGAEIKSFTKTDPKGNISELIWQNDNGAWSSSAPVLFPICGPLKDGKYELNNKEYEMKQHGVIRYKDADNVIQEDVNKAEFIFNSDENTQKNFPFDFEFKVSFSIIFTLDGPILNKNYTIKNLGKENMPFTLGDHEGFNLPNVDNLENFYIEFDRPQRLLMQHNNGKDDLGISKFLPLQKNWLAEKRGKKVFQVRMNDCDSEYAMLKMKLPNSDSKLVTKVTLNSEFFMLWSALGESNEQLKYLCLEPWLGTPYLFNELKQKSFEEISGLRVLKPGETFTHSREIGFGDAEIEISPENNLLTL